MEKSIGPINSIVLARAGESDKIYKKDQNSVELNGLCELMISENQFMNFNDRSDYLQELSDKLFGVEYYLNDFVSTGIMYYDLLDMYNVEIFGKTYNCLMLNDEQNITQGLEENIHTDRPETSETDYKKADTTDRKINQTYLIVDKQNQKIEGVIHQIGDRTDKTTTITADIDGLKSKVSTIADLTNETSGTQIVTLANCVEGEVVELHIYGNNTVFKYQYLSDYLYLSDNLLLGKDKSIIIITNENGNKTYFDLGIEEVLRQSGDTRDEYILKNGQAQIIRRINKDGTIKDNETTEDLGELHILLPKGNNTLEIKDFSANIHVKWAVQNEYTDIFATQVQLSTSITQTSTKIMTEVNKKVDEEEFGTKIEQNSEAVKLAWNQISDYIQMMIINGNASFAILDENKKILMALDKTGQHFYKSDGTTIFGEIGVNKEGNDTYISFAVDGKYGDNITNGMAWGIKTKSDNKFHPIMYLKNYQVVQQGGSYGQLMLTNADLVLTGSVDEGTGGGIQSGDILFGGSALNGLKFVDTNGNNFINIVKGDNTILKPYDMIEFLDEVIFFKNALGGNSLGVGKKYSAGAFTGCKAVITDDGSIALDGNITLGSSLYWGSGSSLDSNGNVTCKKLYETSLAEKKKNFEKMKDNALEIINSIDIYRYNLKTENDKDKKHIGFVIGDKYNYSKEVTSLDNTGVDNYSFTSLCCKAIQEQQKQIEELKKEIEKLKGAKE